MADQLLNPNFRKMIPRNRDENMYDDLKMNKSEAVSEEATPKNGVKFFNGRPATTAQSEAKKKAMITKLRTSKPDFEGSSFGTDKD